MKLDGENSVSSKFGYVSALWPKVKESTKVNLCECGIPDSLFIISCSFWTRERTPGRRKRPSVCAALSLMCCRARVMHGATARPVWRNRDIKDEPNTPLVSVSDASSLPEVTSNLRHAAVTASTINVQILFSQTLHCIVLQSLVIVIIGRVSSVCDASVLWQNDWS